MEDPSPPRVESTLLYRVSGTSGQSPEIWKHASSSGGTSGTQAASSTSSSPVNSSSSAASKISSSSVPAARSYADAGASNRPAALAGSGGGGGAGFGVLAGFAPSGFGAVLVPADLLLDRASGCTTLVKEAMSRDSGMVITVDALIQSFKTRDSELNRVPGKVEVFSERDSERRACEGIPLCWGASRHLFLFLRLPPPGSHAARALAFMARSVSG